VVHHRHDMIQKKQNKNDDDENTRGARNQTTPREEHGGKDANPNPNPNPNPNFRIP